MNNNSSERTLNKIARMVTPLYIGTVETGRITRLPPTSFLDKILGSNMWYESTLVTNSGLSSKVLEWRHGLAVDDFLNTINISYRGEKVYSANVYRTDVGQHINQEIKIDLTWLREAVGISKRYGFSYEV